MITEWDKIMAGFYEEDDEEEIDEDDIDFQDELEVGFMEDFIEAFEDD